MRSASRILFLLLSVVFTIAGMQLSYAQTKQPGAPFTLPGDQNKDSVAFGNSNTDEWHNEPVRISYNKLYSKKEYQPNSSIHAFHRRPFSQPWYSNLGNVGSATRNLLFTPENRLGPTFGYHVFDVYRFDVDSLNYYNTSRPYTSFSYQLGSKLEQIANVLHTQNIKPNWNVAVGYRKVSGPGFYQIQRTSHDNAYLSTNYQSIDRHYKLHAGFVYNKEQQDENGGIVDETQLLDSRYNERKTIDVAFQNDTYGAGGSITRSSVTNMQRDFAFLLDHSYTFGRTDTLYNEDSTRYWLELVPRFSVHHRMSVTAAKYEFKDIRPDSLRYLQFFNQGFVGDGTDSVFMQQKWLGIDNRFLLEGYLGQREKQLQFSAGIGNRVDRFVTLNGRDKLPTNMVNNYVVGLIKKEALKPKEWFYQAYGQLFFTGPTSGSSVVQAEIGKDLGEKWGTLSAGIKQEINNAPYNYTTFNNVYDTINTSFNKESITSINATYSNDTLKFSLGFRNYLISNYIYLNTLQLPDQYAPTFNISQIWARKVFRWRSIVLDNELVYQQQTSDAPINVPTLLGRHQLSIERSLFKSALQIAAGAQVRYHTNYQPAGYAPFFNRFYYQNTYSVNNEPVLSAFFNFRVKRFRAFIMVDQLQQLYSKNLITAPGYAAQNTMLRFGFNWVMIN